MSEPSTMELCVLKRIHAHRAEAEFKALLEWFPCESDAYKEMRDKIEELFEWMWNDSSIA